MGLALAASLLVQSHADAAVRTWNSQRGTWATTGNWLGGTVPTSSDSVYFSGATVGSGTAVSVIATNYTVLGLTFAGSGSTSVTGSIASNQLWIDSEGVTVQAGAGPATISGLQGYLNASGTWRNDSTNTFRVASSLNTSAGNVILTVDGSGNAIYSGIISGAAGRTIGVVKQGTGSLTLSGVNTYANGFTLSSGTLVIGNAAAFSTGTITIGGGVIDSTASFTASAANTQAWNGNFSFLGTSGSLTFGTGAGAAITLGTTPTITVANNTLVVNGTISDGGNTRGLTKSGSGALVLGGSNSFTGTTTLTGGTLGLNSNGSLGTSRLEITGGVLDVNAARTLPVTSQAWNGSFTFLGTNTLDTGTAAVTLGASPIVNVAASSFTIGGAIGETGGARRLEKAGNGLLVLNGTNGSYTGGTLLSGGTIQVGGTAALGTSGSITFGGGALRYTAAGAATDYSSRIKGSTAAMAIDTGTVASVTFAGGIDSTNAGGLTKSGTGALVLTASNSFAGDTTISAGSLQIGSGGSSGWLPSANVANAGRLVFNRSDAYGGSFNGLISGTGGITLSGGTLSLAAANTYSGTTAVNAGLLLLGNTNAVQNSIVNVASGANLSFKSGAGSGTFVLPGLIGSGTVTLQDDGGSPAAVTPTIGSANTSGTFTGILAGSGGFTKVGSGELLLTGSSTINTYTGTTTLQQGTLRLIGNNALGSGRLVIAGGLITTGTGAGVTLVNNNPQSWTGDFSYTPPSISVASGGYLDLGTGTVTLGGSGSTRIITFGGGLTRDLRVGGVITGDLGVEKRGSVGLLALNGNNTYTGNTIVANGEVAINGANTTTGTTILQPNGTLTIGNANALGSGPLVINGGRIKNTVTAITTATPQYWNADFQVLVAGGTFNMGTGPITLGGNRRINVDISQTVIGGSIDDGGAGYSLTKAGASNVLFLTGSNSYSGGTVLESSFINASNSYALGTVGDISFKGGTLRYNAATPLIDISSRIRNSTSAVSIEGAGTVTYASGIDATNVAGLTLATASTLALTLSASNSYGGNTSLSIASNTTLNLNNDYALSSGSLLLSGNGGQFYLDNTSGSPRTLANAVSFSGNPAQAGNFVGSNPLTLSGTTTILESLSLTVTGTAPLTLGQLDASLGTSSVTKLGTGTLVIGEAGPTFAAGTGGFLLSAGTLLVGNGNAVGSGTFRISGGTFGSNGSDISLANIVSTTNANATFIGSNAITLSGTYATGFSSSQAMTNSITSGSLTINAWNVTGTTSTSWNVPIAGGGNTTIGPINASGTSYVLTKSGAGVLTLTGSNAAVATASFTVSGGILKVDNPNALPTTAAFAVSSGGMVGLTANAGDLTRSLGTGAGQISLAGNGGFAAYGGERQVNLGGGAATTWGASSFISGTFTLSSADATGTLNYRNPLSLGSGTGVRVFSVPHGTADVDAIVSGVISSTNSRTLVKVGQGTLSLTAASTFSGTVGIREGVVEIPSLADAGSSSPLGSGSLIELGAAATSGTLRYTGSGHTSNRGLLLAGDAVVDAFGSGSIQFSGGVSGTGAVGRVFALIGTSTVANAFNGIIADGSGTTAVTKAGAGSWTLSGNNTFTGQASVTQGTLVVGHASALGSGPRPLVGGTDAGLGGTAALLLAPGISFNRDLEVKASGSGAAQEVALGGANASGTTAFGTAMIRVARDVTLQAASGGAVRFSSNWTGSSGSGSLTDKSFTFGSAGNAGTVIVSSSIATTGGGMTVAAGILRIADQILRPAPGMPFTIAAAGELAGTGTVAAVVAGAGSVGPGNSPGILLADGVDPTGGLDFDFEFTDLEPLYSSPTLSRNDILRLTGTAPFTASLSAANSVDVYFPAGVAAGQTYRGGFFSDQTTALFSDFSSRISNASFTYYVADAGGTVSYKGNSYSLLPGTILVTPTTTTVATANFSGGTVTNGQITTFVVVPEPGAVTLAAVGAAAAAALVRRRRR